MHLTISRIKKSLEVSYEPFIIGEFIAVVVRWHDIHQKNVFRFGVQSSDLHFEAREHSPVDKNGNSMALKTGLEWLKHTMVKSGRSRYFYFYFLNQL